MTSTQAIRRGEVTIRGLSKSFRIGERSLSVLRNLDFSIKPGECVAVVGASGSGKTTLLRMLAGLETPDFGKVSIDGDVVKGINSHSAVIFQEPRLLPWLTVLQNVTFGLEVRGIDKKDATKRALRYIRLVGLGDFENAYPRQLSGGMAQRVGIARALAIEPEILLLDEPLGALDAMTKISMQQELARIWQEASVTMVLVTHDLEEAIFLADRVLVLPRESSGVPKFIDINLPRPRERGEARFVRYREDLLAEFGLH
jgi:sulfonate transport system ATP-binding protein